MSSYIYGMTKKMLTRSDTYKGHTHPKYRWFETDKLREIFFRSCLYERDNGLCGLCGEPICYSEMHVDHILPKSLGGPNLWDNFQIACPSCNCAKGNRV
jgi:5-methylcytosine-specific restriction endonuclease McrA